MATILAAASAIEKHAGDILIGGLLLMLFFLALGVQDWYYRRWRGGSQTPSTVPWTFDDLRKLRDQGQLSEAEYHRLRDSMVGLYTKVPSSDRGDRSQGNDSSLPLPPKRDQEGDETWDWVAEDDRGSGGFDVKK